MIKVRVNPKYDYLSAEIRNLPAHDYKVEQVFCINRNTVELVSFGDEQFVVKRFKRPTLANCVVYTWLRKPKTRQAYDNALWLSGIGIETAEPVAWVEHYRHGFFHTGWFVSRYLPYKSAREVYDSLTSQNLRRRFAVDFLNFVESLFRKHITNRDFNAGNFLAYSTPKGYRFAMIDINRLKKSRLRLSDETKALDQLGLTPTENFVALQTLAKKSERSLDDIVLSFMVNKKMGGTKQRMKRRLKKVLKTL